MYIIKLGLDSTVADMEDENPNMWENASPGTQRDLSVSLLDVENIQRVVKKMLYYQDSHDAVSTKMFIEDIKNIYGDSAGLYKYHEDDGFLIGFSLPWQMQMTQIHGQVSFSSFKAKMH